MTIEKQLRQLHTDYYDLDQVAVHKILDGKLANTIKTSLTNGVKKLFPECYTHVVLSANSHAKQIFANMEIVDKEALIPFEIFVQIFVKKYNFEVFVTVTLGECDETDKTSDELPIENIFKHIKEYYAICLQNSYEYLKTRMAVNRRIKTISNDKQVISNMATGYEKLIKQLYNHKRTMEKAGIPIPKTSFDLNFK